MSLENISRWLSQWVEPDGFVLEREDGTEHNRIRGDLIPSGTVVIVEDGRSFVATGEQSPHLMGDWRVYREGFKTLRYEGQGE